MAVLVLTTDLRGAIDSSGVGVLVYYAIANASAWTLGGPVRRWLRPVAALGLVGCLVLAATLPAASVVTGLAVLAVGVAARAVRRGLQRRRGLRP